jgi:hypothetical protein
VARGRISLIGPGRGFLWKVVTDAAGELAVLVGAGEVLGVGGRLGMKRSISVAFERDGRNADGGVGCELRLDLVVSGFTLCQLDPLAIAVDGNGDMVRVLERLR